MAGDEAAAPVTRAFFTSPLCCGTRRIGRSGSEVTPPSGQELPLSTMADGVVAPTSCRPGLRVRRLDGRHEEDAIGLEQLTRCRMVEVRSSDIGTKPIARTEPMRSSTRGCFRREGPSTIPVAARLPAPVCHLRRQVLALPSPGCRSSRTDVRRAGHARRSGGRGWRSRLFVGDVRRAGAAATWAGSMARTELLWELAGT